MTRKKVKLVWISNETARKVSLKKRRVGLLKKVSELTILCGVDALCIIHSPDDDEPVVWPNHSTVERLLIRYQDLSEIERCKKMMNQESYLRERIEKALDQSKKHQRKNQEMGLNFLMQQLHQGKDIDDFDLSEMQSFVWLIQEKMKDIRKRIDYFQPMPLTPPGPFTSNRSYVEEIGLPRAKGIVEGEGDEMVNPSDPLLWDQWLIDMVINNENGTCTSSTRSDMGLPYGFYNRSCASSSSGINMGIQSLHKNVERISNTNLFSLRLHDNGNFWGGGSNRSEINLELPYNMGDNSYGGDVIGVGLPHETLEGSDRNGVLGVMGLVDSDLGGNNEGNDDVLDLGLPHRIWEGGNDGRNFPDVEMPHNKMGGNIHERNWDYVELPNENPDELGNEMRLGMPNENFATNSRAIDWNNGVGLEVANDLRVSSRGGIAGSDIGFQAGFFEGAIDIELPYDVTKPRPNSLSP